MVIRDYTKFIKSYYGETDSLIGAEIGVYKGGNAKTIKEHLNPKLLILVDAWSENVEPSDKYDDTSHSDNLLLTYNNFADDDNVIIIRGQSTVVATMLKVSFDFVYIDAGHVYQSIKEDIPAWYPLVKSAGIIGGHDYNMTGVSAAVKEHFVNKEILTGYRANNQGVDWWVVKNGS